MRAPFIIFCCLLLSASVGARGGRGGGGRGSSGARGGGRSVAGSIIGSLVSGVFRHRGSSSSSGSSSDYTISYVPDKPFATPNRTDAFKRALVAEVRKTSGGLVKSRIYFVDPRRYYWSRPLLLSDQKLSEPPTTAPVPPLDDHWLQQRENESFDEWTHRYKTAFELLYGKRVKPASREICGRNVFGDDPILGVVFRRSRKSQIQRNGTTIYWACELGEFCCGFECCPKDAQQQNDGYYTMREVREYANPVWEIVGILFIVFLIFVFLYIFLQKRKKKRSGESDQNDSERNSRRP